MSEPQPAEWRPIPRPSPLYDKLPRGWLLFDDDAVEKAGRLRYGVAWTGLEYDARQREEAVLSAINALSDEELARENERRLKLIDEAARQQRAQLASAAAQGETIRMTPPEGAEEAIARARAADREALERLDTAAGRAAAAERMKELTRDFLQAEEIERLRPLRERWDTARHQLVGGIVVGDIAAAVWRTPSRQLIPLRPDEACTLVPRRRERIWFDGEPGWLVVSAEDIDRAFSRRERARTGRPPLPIWSAIEADALKWLEDEGAPMDSGDLAAFEKRVAELAAEKGEAPSESQVRVHCHRYIETFAARRRGDQ